MTCGPAPGADLGQVFGEGHQVMAAFRNLAITAMRLSGATNIAAALRHHARETLRPLATYKIT